MNSTGNQYLRLLINSNGKFWTNSATDLDAILYTRVGNSAPQSQSIGDLPGMNNQYEAGRLAAVKIKWYPGLPNGSVTAPYYPMILMYDQDGIDGQTAVSGSINQFLEETNGCKAYNMYRPWSKYIKFPKQRVNTKAQTSLPYLTPPQGQQPSTFLANQNVAGLFHDPASALAPSLILHPNIEPPLRTWNGRAAHIAVSALSPDLTDGEDLPIHIGTYQLTFYFVLKDRK